MRDDRHNRRGGSRLSDALCPLLQEKGHTDKRGRILKEEESASNQDQMYRN